MTLWQEGDYQISTDKKRLDIPAIHDFLVNAYWSKGRSLDVVRQSVEHSLCFGLYHQQGQIGFGVSQKFWDKVFGTEIIIKNSA